MAQDKDSADHVMVRAIRPFEGVEGHKDEASEPFRVHSRRAAELKANGLVEDAPAAPATRAAPEPENKMAPEPANKTIPAVSGRRTGG